MRFIPSALATTIVVGFFAVTSSAAPLRVLFLGDNAGHRPTNRFALMQPALASRGIDLTYTDKRPAHLEPPAVRHAHRQWHPLGRRRQSGFHREALTNL